MTTARQRLNARWDRPELMLDEMRSEAKALADDLAPGRYFTQWTHRQQLYQLIESRNHDELHELLRLLRAEWARQNPTTEDDK